MGLDLTYDADGATFTHRFSQADWDIIGALRGHLPEQIGVCFDVPDFGEPVRISAAALKQCALDIDRFLADNAKLLPATYYFKLDGFPVPGTSTGFETGGAFGGLRLPNDPDHFYMIRAGVNELGLTKMWLGPDGKHVMTEYRDLRNETELQTENAGKVQFRRRAAKTTLRRALREIATFADRVASKEITKVVG